MKPRLLTAASITVFFVLATLLTGYFCGWVPLPRFIVAAMIFLVLGAYIESRNP